MKSKEDEEKKMKKNKKKKTKTKKRKRDAVPSVAMGNGQAGMQKRRGHSELHGASMKGKRKKGRRLSKVPFRVVSFLATQQPWRGTSVLVVIARKSEVLLHRAGVPGHRCSQSDASPSHRCAACRPARRATASTVTGERPGWLLAGGQRKADLAVCLQVAIYLDLEPEPELELELELYKLVAIDGALSLSLCGRF
ncbi:hypothetical protein TRV_04117 [Trichophyton verrucosum HKI 0517]|uniref:Uncharacterized protein n=1 Tax=Trichophyton verrucosum (strain HKI 0517) TaxID=663202 RepID=D4DAH0_TRIVH|nr:uncharacterized protein TRV_04117 [Trichophyton verrucosum HKI 0517]EFE41168.1 hypothetical protein TRV_04117 [Trichophyton verrucosum HKI 0517]